MKNQAFEKFTHAELKGAHKKEYFKQQKRLLRKEDQEKFKNKNSVKKDSEFPRREVTQPIVKEKFQKFSRKENIATENNSGKPLIFTEPIPLNKYIAHAGICSRREAADKIRERNVTVNGKELIEPGFKVTGREKICYRGQVIKVYENLVYLLVNKPKDFISTSKDPQGRKTVMELVSNATQERIFPVGRLDRNTTGLLLFTNDGELTQKLTHPAYEIKKIYEAKLDKPLKKEDLNEISNGIQLEDGFIKPDNIAYADSKDASIIGIEIHSGKNRIVRRIFESRGYNVEKLDRVMLGNLTKRGLERGKWRFLTPSEVRSLKFLNQRFIKKNRPSEK